MPSQTKGQALTATLRDYFSIGTRTRRYPRDKHRPDLHAAMIEALKLAATVPDYYTPRTETALRPGYAAALAYDKHVGGYRIDGDLRRVITEMSPWQFAALLGQMVDAGITNVGEGERFFAAMARQLHAKAS